MLFKAAEKIAGEKLGLEQIWGGGRKKVRGEGKTLRRREVPEQESYRCHPKGHKRAQPKLHMSGEEKISFRNFSPTIVTLPLLTSNLSENSGKAEESPSEAAK